MPTNRRLKSVNSGNGESLINAENKFLLKYDVDEMVATLMATAECIIRARGRRGIQGIGSDGLLKIVEYKQLMIGGARFMLSGVD